ncbi:MAG: copper amine oxidase N-terminal domain-containing protein [Syntrophomonas sp.]
MRYGKILLLSLLLLFIGSMPSMAATTNKPLASTLHLYVDGKEVKFPDQKPYIDANNRTMVPVRFPAQTLGAHVDFNFNDPQHREVYISQDAHGDMPEAKITLTIGDQKVKVNGQAKTMDTVAVCTNGRTMVPVKFISEFLGAEVRWHDASKAAHIFTEGQSKSEQDEIILDTATSLGIKHPTIPDPPARPTAPTAPASSK